MSRTHSHKVEAKFKRKLIELSEVPENVYSKWNRYNFDRGKHRLNRKNQIEKQLNYETSLVLQNKIGAC